jgi:hypothetical protein
VIAGIAVRTGDVQGGHTSQIGSAEEFVHAFADAGVFLISTQKAGWFRADSLVDCCAVFRHTHLPSQAGHANADLMWCEKCLSTELKG